MKLWPFRSRRKPMVPPLAEYLPYWSVEQLGSADNAIAKALDRRLTVEDIAALKRSTALIRAEIVRRYQ